MAITMAVKMTMLDYDDDVDDDEDDDDDRDAEIDDGDDDEGDDDEDDDGYDDDNDDDDGDDAGDNDDDGDGPESPLEQHAIIRTRARADVHAKTIAKLARPAAMRPELTAKRDKAFSACKAVGHMFALWPKARDLLGKLERCAKPPAQTAGYKRGDRKAGGGDDGGRQCWQRLGQEWQ